MEEAMHLAKFASKVLILIRRSKADLRASKAMQERILADQKIEFLEHTESIEALGDGKLLTGLKIINNLTQTVSEIEIGGLFFAIGHTPNTSFLDNQIKLDDAGYIKTIP